MADFEYTSTTIDESSEFAVDEIRFGDGYSQRIPSGVNNSLRTWSVTFSDRSLADATAMIAFWRARYGSTSFTWRPQGYDADVTVVCKQYSRPMQTRFIDGDFVYTITARFEEVPA